MQVSSRSQGSRSLGAALCAASVLALALFATLAPAAMAAPATASYVVVLKDDVAHPAHLAHRHEANRGAEITHIYGVAIKGYSADLTPGQLKAIRKDPNVKYAEIDGVIRPKGQAVGNQLKRVYANLSRLHIDENDVPADRVNADIAILDTGVYQHPDLNIVSRVNCVGGGGGCKPGQFDDDAYGHGTHVAGDAAAIDNGFGAVGTAPGARIWSVKVIKRIGYIGTDEVGMSLGGIVSEEDGGTITNLEDGNNRMSDAIAGIDYVTAHSSEIEVANMSFACATDEWGCAHTALAEAIASSVNSGVVWVAAAGQEGMGVANNFYKIRHYPALLSDVITVSAMADYDGLPGSLSNADACPLEKGFQHDDRLMGEGKPQNPKGVESGGLGSNHGPEVDMTAPGSCVFSTWSPINPGGSNAYGIPGGSEYGFMYGSSVASALVAGAAADIAAEFNPNSRADVENIRNVLISAGNYNWEDLTSDGDGGAYVSPDGVKEPLLDMSKLGAPVKGPVASTYPATEVGLTSAKLNGWVNPGGAATSYVFEYGKTMYESSIPVPAGSAGSGTSAVYVWNILNSLEPGATYHYRVVASNSTGTAYGGDQQFTTPSDSHPASMRDASTNAQWTYYRNSDGYLWELYRNPSTGQWANSKIPAVQAVTTGTSPVIGRNATSKAQWIYYQGTERGIWELYRNPSTGNWSNTKIPGAQAAPGSSPAMMGDPSAGAAWIYYRATDGYLWELYRNPSTGQWANTKVPATQAAAAGATPAIGRNATTGAQYVYYRGSDGGIWELYRNPSTGQWANSKLPYALVAPGSSPVLMGDPSAGAAWIYYRATDGYIYELYRNPTTGVWANSKVPATQAAAPGTTPAIGRNATTNAQWAYYDGADGGVWELYRNPSTGQWSNTKVPNAQAGPWSSPNMIGDPSAGAAWIYYRGSDNYVWELWRNPSTGVWANSKFTTAQMG